MLTTSRRKFLASVSAATAASAGMVSLSQRSPGFLWESAALGAEASKRDEKILVVVQLSGGNDGLNTIVPYRDERYTAARPSLAFDKNAVLKIDDDFGFHPNLKGMAKLLEEKKLSILQGIGYPNPNRSHFESMDIWHAAQLTEAPGKESFASKRDLGWLGHVCDIHKAQLQASSDPATIHFGEESQPLALAARDMPALSIRSLDNFRLDTGNSDKQRQAIQTGTTAARTSPNDLLKFVQTRATSALEVSQRLAQSTQTYKTSVSYPGTPLAGKLKNIAQLIDAGLATRIYYVALDGFDTHSDQAAAHAGLMSHLGDALAAFGEDLSSHGQQDRVMTLVFSEFGRRVSENASRGTDHGAAAPMFLMGSKVIPGLVGQHPSLGDLVDGDLKHHTDFRTIYAALLENWLGFPSAPILGNGFPPAKIFA